MSRNILTKAMVYGTLALTLLLTASSVSALQIQWGDWGYMYEGKTNDIWFTHEDRDVAGGVNPDGTLRLDYEGPIYEHSSSGTQEIGSGTGSLTTSGTGDLGTVSDGTPQPNASSTSVTSSDASGSDQASFGIDLGVSGRSDYNWTNAAPLHSSDSDNPDPNPPDITREDYTYYNNWDYTTANSNAYGAFNGFGNTFSVGDGDDVEGEQFVVTGSFSYDYLLGGDWFYMETTNEDGYTFDERRGHFYTSFLANLHIYDEDGGDIVSSAFDEIFRDESLIATSGNTVTQSKAGTDAFLFSFVATEGVDYTFMMEANMYGHADGIAGYNSTGSVSLDLAVSDYSSTPEPGTILLVSIGGMGIGLCRRRFKRKN